MKTSLWTTLSILASLLSGAVAMAIDTQPAANNAEVQRKQHHQAFQQGNFKDAYEGLRKILLDKDVAPQGQDLTLAVQCLQRLNRMGEIDELLESAVKTHQDDPRRWAFLWDVANQYTQVPHQGFIIAGKFVRGPHRGGTAKVVNTMARDRARALQLMVQALGAARKDDDHNKVGTFLLALSDMFLQGRHGQQESWQLQYKTDLDVLPDYEEGWDYFDGQTRGAPVDESGKPVFHVVPKSFETAETDGQRWRWCLEQAMEFNAARTNEIRMRFAGFLWQQFGVQTMAQLGWRFGRDNTDDSQENESGTYALNTLGEDETIARLATGVKRFKLPEEFNFLAIYQGIAADPKTGYGAEALERLAQIFENRRQYPRAAEVWRRLLKEYANQPPHRIEGWKQRLEQIVGNWGRFEPVSTQPAGRGATVEYRFRNGTAIELTAHEVNVKKLLDDVKAYIKTRPKQMNWEQMNIGDIGYRLVQRDQKQYLGQQVAQWRMEVKPRQNHFDKRVTIATPLQKAGAYLLKAKMADGNESFIILWLNDTSIVKKPLGGDQPGDARTYYYVADAASGRPVPKANLEFFGWRQEWKGNNNVVVHLKNFAELADADGQFLADQSVQPPDYQWIITATTEGGRFAYLGFTNVWYGQRHDPEYHQSKIFTITDRPVYRPEQPVKFKFWIRHAKYDLPEDRSDFAGQEFTVEIHNPKGEKVLSETKKADEYGGLEGEWKVPADATLGVYNVIIPGPHVSGGSTFRVEEYKKPEFEVTVDAPKDPVMLGEKIEAVINAKYYFGSPVTKAKVKYKVQRATHSEDWYPYGPWDWLFGPGYWWYAYDYVWYPGWRDWGCWRPMPFWWPRPQLPPELVAEREVEIGADGTVKVEIDTAVAKAIHADKDHSYSITAEVVDQSRRTIVGSGQVLVARKPFKVYAWVDRGYFRVGDTIRAGFNARRLDGKPVEGKGELTLLRITYDKKQKPLETPVQTWKVNTDEEGQAQQQIKAGEAGQYRLSYKLTDAKQHTIEGGYVFTIIGEGFDGSQFRFNAVEIIPDKADYAPGEKIKLQINVDRAGGTVLLFSRPTNGIYLKPTVIRLDGKSTVKEIEVTKRDMPNFFVEAVTIADGRVHTETKEIVVPPEKRVLNVEITPSALGKKDGFQPASEFKPGQKAKVQVKLTDLEGKPFVGSTVVAIYDKSVEYISGGSNVPEIKEFFWKWRRHHNPQTETNLAMFFHNLMRPNARGMNDLGVFGHSVPEEEGELEDSGPANMEGGGMGGMGGGGRPGAMRFQSGAPQGAMLAMDRAMPAMAPPAAKSADMAVAEATPMEAPQSGQADPGAAAALVEPTVRSKFADTALWVGNLTTQANGTAEVALDMPENLTTWRIKVWGMGHGTKVGQGQVDVVTRKDLIIRLQAPRFFVEKDEVVLSAVVHNYLKTKKKVQVALELGGPLALTTTLVQRFPDGTEARGIQQDPHPFVEIPANGEARVDWRVKVLDEGEAVVRMKALTDEESDAMEQKFPCYIHGMLKMEAWSGALRPKDTSGTMAMNVPEERRPRQSRIEVRYSPTLAGSMVDALPYLVDFPYGCTEQTVNRFLPTVVTQKILLDMKLDLQEIQKKRTNLNAQEIGEDKERAKQWKRYERNPVFDQDEVRKMVKDGVNRLTEMQLSDGGWGWFSGWGEHSTPHTTALVVHGLQLAKANDAALVPGVLERGVEWLKRYQSEQVQLIKNAAIKDKPPHLRWKEHADEQDAFNYMVLVEAGVKSPDMLEFLYRDRTKLAVYALAMYGIALDKQGEKEKLAMVMRNISQYVQQDDENQTAWLNLPGGYWWYWYGSEYEAHAYYLKLLARTDAKGELAPRLVKYLLNNRKHATYWNSTRDTAIVIEAFAEYLRASGEDKPDMTVEVHYDGKLQKAVEITGKNLFLYDNQFVLEGEAVAAGKHEVKLVKKGTGPLYYNGYLSNFTLEDFITKAGLEIKVQRKYYKLVKADKTVKAAGSRGQAVDQKVEKYDRQELANLAELTSGDLVEIELEIDGKNDYEYLVFEDMKPAGFEPVDQRSGYTGNDLGAYVEYRDNRVVFFARTLARGKHSVAYRMRAEQPGKFSALPTRAWAMYAPELKGNSDEIKLQVKD